MPNSYEITYIATKNGEQIGKGSARQLAQQFGLKANKINYLARRDDEYEGIRFERYVKGKKEKITDGLEEMINIYGNTICCEKEIEPFIEMLRNRGIEATYRKVKDGRKYYYVLERAN